MRDLRELLNEITNRYRKDLDGRQLLMIVFETPADRQEFITALHAAKPGMCTFHIPETGH